jgi:hypothetical protein
MVHDHPHHPHKLLGRQPSQVKNRVCYEDWDDPLRLLAKPVRRKRPSGHAPQDFMGPVVNPDEGEMTGERILERARLLREDPRIALISRAVTLHALYT